MENILENLTIDFKRNHEVVKKGQQTFIEVGNALMKIREGKQYKELNYKTFEDYCKSEFNIARRTAYQLIDAAETTENVRHGAQNELPQSERQLRELSKVPKEDQAEVWIKVQTETGKTQPTAKEIKEIINSRTMSQAKKILELLDKYGTVSTNVVKQVYPDMPTASIRGRLTDLEKEKKLSFDKLVPGKYNKRIKSYKRYKEKEDKEEIIKDYDFKYISKRLKKGGSVAVDMITFNSDAFQKIIVLSRRKGLSKRCINLDDPRQMHMGYNPFRDGHILDEDNFKLYQKVWLKNNPTILSNIKDAKNYIFYSGLKNDQYSISQYVVDTLVRK